jgi:hypothetical protein
MEIRRSDFAEQFARVLCPGEWLVAVVVGVDEGGGDGGGLFDGAEVRRSLAWRVMISKKIVAETAA